MRVPLPRFPRRRMSRLPPLIIIPSCPTNISIKMTTRVWATQWHRVPMEKIVKRWFLRPCWIPTETRDSILVLCCVARVCLMDWVEWYMKTMDVPMKVIGGMAVGMDMAGPPLLMVIPTKVNIVLINVTDVECTVGPMDVSMMGPSWKTSDMAMVPSNGPMEPPMKVTLYKDNERDMDDIRFRMVDIIWDLGSMDVTKDSGNVIGKTEEHTKENGELVWLMDKVSKRIPMGVSVMMDNGSMMNPYVEVVAPNNKEEKREEKEEYQEKNRLACFFPFVSYVKRAF
mmetsp:Transcript_27310/g.63422  ORF Transcript_27310/g.63422 Transcript_27310/m.63422 type:complete len:284 (+) Transcript_27310:914-1765(+)